MRPRFVVKSNTIRSADDGIASYSIRSDTYNSPSLSRANENLTSRAGGGGGGDGGDALSVAVRGDDSAHTKRRDDGDDDNVHARERTRAREIYAIFSIS